MSTVLLPRHQNRGQEVEFRHLLPLLPCLYYQGALG